MKVTEINLGNKINEDMNLEELLGVITEEVKKAIEKEEEIDESATKVDFDAPYLDEIDRVQGEFADFGNNTDCIYTKGVYALFSDQLRHLYMLGHAGVIEEKEVKEIFRFLMITFGYIQEEQQ